MLGVSLKVIYPALINCKSFLLNAKKVSILWPRFLAWYLHIRSDFYQFRNGGFNGGNKKGAT